MKPGESSDVGIDADSFAEASVQARIEADLELDRLRTESKMHGQILSQQTNNDVWKKHFQSSEFFKKYKAHLLARQEKRQIADINNQNLAQMNKDYSDLEKKYNEMLQMSQSTQKMQTQLLKKMQEGPVKNELMAFATGMNGDEDLGEDITMKGDKFHYVQRQPVKGVTFAQEDPVAADADKPAPIQGPEKVETLDPKICKTHTTFYDKNGQKITKCGKS